MLKKNTNTVHGDGENDLLVLMSEVISRYRDHIIEMKEDIETIMREEQEERKIRALENQTNKAQRLLENGDNSNDKRHWFQSYKQRKEEKGEVTSVYLGQLYYCFSVRIVLLLLLLLDRLVGLVVKASASWAEEPGFESCLRQDFSGVGSYQWLKHWHSSGYPARRLAL